MNVLVTSTSYIPAIGGAQTYAHGSLRSVAHSGKVKVLCQWTQNRNDWLLGSTVRSPRASTRYEAEGIAVETIVFDAKQKLRMAPWVAGYYAAKGLCLGQLTKSFAGAVASYSDDVDLIQNCRIGREPLSVASLQVARKRDVPFVLVPFHHPRWVGWNYREYLKLYTAADGLIALTESERQTLIRLGVQSDRIHVTGMGPVVGSQADAARARRSFSLDDNPIVLFVGQKFQYKGLEQMLDAASEVWSVHPDAKFVFVGPRTRFSKRLFSGVRDQRVLELPAVSTEDKTDLLAAASTLCLPSTQESFGGVFLEAWSVGTPVIGVDIPAVAEVVTNGSDGILTSQDAGEIAEAIVQLLNNPLLSRRMGAEGKKKVQQKYSWEQVARKHHNALKTVTGSQCEAP